MILFAGIIAIPAVGWWRFDMNPIVAFWFAYIVTRPLGASFADWFTKSPSITGLGLGDGTVSALALIVFLALVTYVAVTKCDVQDELHLAPQSNPGLVLDAEFERSTNEAGRCGPTSAIGFVANRQYGHMMTPRKSLPRPGWPSALSG